MTEEERLMLKRVHEVLTETDAKGMSLTDKVNRTYSFWFDTPDRKFQRSEQYDQIATAATRMTWTGRIIIGACAVLVAANQTWDALVDVVVKASGGGK